MNRDLEAQLDEMGGAYRAVAYRLAGARRAEDVRPPAPAARPRWAYLLAASLAAAVGLSAVLFRTGGSERASRPERYPSEYALAFHRDSATVRELIRTQQPDGGWKNDFLTRQNAAALRACDSDEARIAYKKAMRNLRFRGVL